MSKDAYPTSLTSAAIKALPIPALQRSIDVLMARMRRVHPRLFRDLRRLNPAAVRIVPTDAARPFLLTFGGSEARLMVGEGKSDAEIKGTLDALLKLLEGRVDGDTLFFARDLEIAGNTAAVVALRNTLDREEIDLLEDVAGLFGPFARPFREAVLLIDKVAAHMSERRRIAAQ